MARDETGEAGERPSMNTATGMSTNDAEPSTSRLSGTLSQVGGMQAVAPGRHGSGDAGSWDVTC